MAPVTSIRAREEQRLAEEALPLLEQVIRRVAGRQFDGSQREELRSMAYVAMTELIRKYDPSRSPFAPYMRARLRWALLDAIRRKTHSRTVVARLQAWRSSERLLEEQKNQAEAAFAEPVMDLMQLPSESDYKDQLQCFLREHAAVVGIALVAAGIPGGAMEAAAPDSQVNPERVMLQRNAEERVRNLVSELKDERLRALIEGHYFRGETLETIGQRLGISKSWASRLHHQAMTVLAEQLHRSGYER